MPYSSYLAVNVIIGGDTDRDRGVSADALGELEFDGELKERELEEERRSEILERSLEKLLERSSKIIRFSMTTSRCQSFPEGNLVRDESLKLQTSLTFMEA